MGGLYIGTLAELARQKAAPLSDFNLGSAEPIRVIECHGGIL